MKKWIKAARLRTLPLSLSGILVGGGLANADQLWDLKVFLACIFTTLSLQILSNFANDYGDGVKGTDDHRTERMLGSGAISAKSMKNAVILWSVLSFIGAIYIVYQIYVNNGLLPLLIFFALSILSIIAAITYTMGKKAYGYRALGDVFVFIFFGLVAVGGSYYAIAHQWSFKLILPSITIGLLSVAVLNLNNMRDSLSDLKANKITLAIKLGAQKAKVYQYTLYIMAFLAWIGIITIQNESFIVALPFIVLFRNMNEIKKVKEPKLYDPFLKKVALSTFAMALLLFIYSFDFGWAH